MATEKKKHPWTDYNPNPHNDPENASPELLNPANHSLLLIDHESQMFFGVESHSRIILRNNIGMVSNLSKVYDIPTIVTTVSEETFSGPIAPEMREFFPDRKKFINRTTMNAWEDTRVANGIKGFNRKKLVIAGLWTEVCVVFPALSALSDGFEVYVISDASGGVSREAHDMAMERLIQAGVKPVTSMQYVLEVHRDWARKDKYREIGAIAERWGGTYGLGIDYKANMIAWKEEKNKSEGKAKTAVTVDN